MAHMRGWETYEDFKNKGPSWRWFNDWHNPWGVSEDWGSEPCSYHVHSKGSCRIHDRVASIRGLYYNHKRKAFWGHISIVDIPVSFQFQIAQHLDGSKRRAGQYSNFLQRIRNCASGPCVSIICTYNLHEKIEFVFKLKNCLSAQSVQSLGCALTQWVAKDASFLLADSEDADQTGQMPRLIWVFAGSTGHFVDFVTLQLKWHVDFQTQKSSSSSQSYNDSTDAQNMSSDMKYCSKYRVLGFLHFLFNLVIQNHLKSR